MTTNMRPDHSCQPFTTSFPQVNMDRAMNEVHKANFEIDLDRLGTTFQGRRVPASVMALSAMASLAQMVSARPS